MQLSKNSLSAKVYRDFYYTQRMPDSLCPYFWKLVLAWLFTILFFPLLIPVYIIKKISKDTETGSLGVKALIGFLLYVALLFLFSIGVFISSIWITYRINTIMYQLFVGGGIVLTVICLGSSYIGITYLIKYMKNKSIKYDENGIKVTAQENPNLVAEFIKAKYNKYCPKINWE